MRKVLSFVLVLSLVLGSFGFAFAAPADVQGTKNEIAVEVLMALDIINGYEDGTYRPDNIVTRAEMAKILIAASGYGDIVNEAKSNFSDMAGHWADKYVAYAASLGLVNGYPDGTFKPNQTVTYAEAATMMVRALGYTDVALAGTWPANYVTKAMVLGLFDKVSTKVGGASRGDIAQMTFALLDEDFGKVDKDNIWQPDQSGDTMLKRLGTIEHKNYPVYPSDNSGSKSYIDLTNYVGQVVDLYKESKGDEKIVAVTKVHSDVIKGEYDHSKQIVKGFDGKTYTLTAAPAFTYQNANVKGNAVPADFDREAVTVVGTLSGLRMEPRAITSWIPALVKKIGSSDLYNIEDVVNDNYDDLLGYKVPLKSDKTVNYGKMKVTGDVTKLEDVEKDDVVVIYTDFDNSNNENEIVRIDVNRIKIEGKVNKKTNEGAPNAVTIGDKGYRVSAESGAKAFGSYALGATVEAYAYTTELGTYLYDFKEIEAATAGNYAMVISTSNGNDEYGIPARIKLLTKDNEIINFDIDERAKFSTGGSVDMNLTYVDSDVIKVTAQAIAAVSPQAIVKYSTNASGDINKIVQAAAADSAQSVDYNSSTNRFANNTLKVSSNVVLFRYNTNDPTKSKVITLADLEDDAAKPFNAIIAMSDNSVVAVAVTDLKEADDLFGVVTSVGDVLDADDNIVQEVNMLVNGEAKTYLTAATFGTKMTKNNFYKLVLSGGKIVTGTVSSKTAVELKDDIKIRTITAIDTDANVITATTNGGVTTDSYAYGDTATIYVATFRSDDTFDKWAKASETILREGAYVVTYDLYNDDETGVNKGRTIYDTIFVVRKADISKYNQ